MSQGAWTSISDFPFSPRQMESFSLLRPSHDS
ncbi:hypothetical protein RCH22_001473 [Cryobacterium psychrotolerans]|nr:hypothetical protein [Cryobacterium psychrotolerans]